MAGPECGGGDRLLLPSAGLSDVYSCCLPWPATCLSLSLPGLVLGAGVGELDRRKGRAAKGIKLDGWGVEVWRWVRMDSLASCNESLG